MEQRLTFDSLGMCLQTKTLRENVIFSIDEKKKKRIADNRNLKILRYGTNLSNQFSIIAKVEAADA